MTGPSSQHLHPAPGAADKLDRLKGLLREMFQLDRGDLDFGIYRVMNLKAAEIAEFLDRDLLPQVKRALNLTNAESIASLQEELQEQLQGFFLVVANGRDHAARTCVFNRHRCVVRRHR